MIAYHQYTALQPQFWIINALFSILLPQISFIQPQFSISNSSSCIVSQKCGKYDSKCPQNIRISFKMSASFFQVWLTRHTISKNFYESPHSYFLRKPWKSSLEEFLYEYKRGYTFRIWSWCKCWQCMIYLWIWLQSLDCNKLTKGSKITGWLKYSWQAKKIMVRAQLLSTSCIFCDPHILNYITPKL